MVHAVLQADDGERLLRPHGIARDLGDQRHVLARGQARHQIVELEHEADMVAAVERQRAVVEAAELMVGEPDLAGGGAVEAADDVEEGRLARARRPEDDHELARRRLEIDAAQGVHLRCRR